MKAAGGGKMVPAKDYKARKDIGQQRKAETRVQQPTKERGSAKLDPRAAQRKAAMERRAKKAGAKTPTAAFILLFSGAVFFLSAPTFTPVPIFLIVWPISLSYVCSHSDTNSLNVLIFTTVAYTLFSKLCFVNKIILIK